MGWTVYLYCIGLIRYRVLLKSWMAFCYCDYIGQRVSAYYPLWWSSIGFVHSVATKNWIKYNIIKTGQLWVRGHVYFRFIILIVSSFAVNYTTRPTQSCGHKIRLSRQNKTPNPWCTSLHPPSVHFTQQTPAPPAPQFLSPFIPLSSPFPSLLVVL